MPTPNENPVRFADGLSVCGICEREPVVIPGMLCVACQEMALEWAEIGKCRPDECACSPEQDEEGTHG